MPDWVKNLFDFDGTGASRSSVFQEMRDAGTWAKNVIRKVVKESSLFDNEFIDFPLIQRDPIRLRGDHLNLYGQIRSPPTADLYHLCKISGHTEAKFFEIINDLIRDNYLRILSMYFNLNLNEYVEPLFREFLIAKIEEEKKK